ncbi:MAG: hypothetical protein ACO3DT_12195, partial [Gammaproteobacteria bacterium]
MWSAPQEMSKIGLYMVDADAQQAAMALARMAVLHPLEGPDGEALPENPAAPYHQVYHDLHSRFGKISGFIRKPIVAPPESTGVVTLDRLQALDQQ